MNYWKIRALALLAAEAQDACADAINRYYEAMKAEGLNPSTPHAYDDATETITEKKTEKKTDGHATRHS